MTDDKLAIFTICSNNYMPMARLLLQSARLHCQEADLFVCLADRVVEWDGLYEGEGFTIVPIENLDIPDLTGFTFRYDIMELNTAAKPFMFLHLIEELGYTQVLYFDPDIEIHAPLDPILTPLRGGASIALTPHLLQPQEDEIEPNDVTIMRAGVFNLGFLGVARTIDALDTLYWWARRLTHQCVNNQVAGLFVDQKFMDLVPCFVPSLAILRAPGLNVAYWNLPQRQLLSDGGAYTVDGEPLIFFHFSGFDPEKPDRLSKHTPRFNADMNETLTRITASYAARLLQAGFGSIPRATYAFGRFASGTPIPDQVRRMFRDEHPAWPDDPFETFEAFLHQPWTGAKIVCTRGAVTNFLAYLHRTSHHLSAVVDIRSEYGQNVLIDWYLKHAARELSMDERMIYPVAQSFGATLPADLHGASSIPVGERDISVIGYLSTSSGVGEVGRANLRALVDSGVRAEGIDVSLGVVSDRSDVSVTHHLASVPRGRARLFNINADQLPLVMSHMRDLLSEPAYTIVNPFWELAEFPDAWLPAFTEVDEIWAQSRFIQLMLSRKLQKPVIYVPVPLQVPDVAPLRRSELGLPERRFLFFFSFDFLSFVDRKNPVGAIEAFRRAFPRGATDHEAEDRPALVIKTMNGTRVPEALRNLRELTDSDPDMFLIDRVLPRPEVAALIGLCDAVLSLHRAEGFGLLVAEAMLLGRPVIATDYASTTELVLPATGFPVDFRLMPVPAGAYPFADGQVWADPDIDHAAWLMKRLVAHPETAKAKTQAARAHVDRLYSPARVATLQKSRLRELGLIN